MPILTAAVLGTAAIKGLKKAAPYIAAAGVAAGAYVAHKYSIHKIKRKYRNTTIDLKTAKEINEILTNLFSSAIEGNLKTNSKEELVSKVVEKALIKTDTENVSILTASRIFEKKALDEGHALGSPKEDMEESISQLFDSYFQKKEDNEKPDKAEVIMHAINNVCICLINEIDALANIPGKEARDMLNNTLFSLKLFLKNVYESEYLMGSKYGMFESDRHKIIADVAQKVSSWGEKQKITQQAKSSKLYFEYNQKQAYQLFHTWAFFSVQTLDDEAARKRQTLTLDQIFQGAYSEKARIKILGENVKNILPNEIVGFIRKMDDENNIIKINGKGSLLKNYLKNISTLDEKKSIKEFGTSSLALSAVGSKNYKKDESEQEQLGTKIHEINHKVAILNLLLIDYVNSLEKYGSLPGISSGTFEFKRLLIKDLIAEIKSDIQNILELPYYQALKKEFESEQTTSAIKKMIPSNHQKNIATRSSNNEIDDFNIPKQGPKECRAFDAWEEIISRIQKIEKSYDETLDIVAEKKKKLAPNDNSHNPFEEPKTVIQDLQALSIQDYITDLSFATFHNFLELPKNSQEKKLVNIQVDKGKETVNNCYSLIQRQVQSLKSLQRQSEIISSWRYKVNPSSSIGKFYTDIKTNNDNQKFIKFSLEIDYHDENYVADTIAMVSNSAPTKGSFSMNFDSIYSIDDLRDFYRELQLMIQTYKKGPSELNLESTDPYYKEFLILETGIKAFLDEYAKNEIGNNILQSELEERIKQVEILKTQKQHMENKYKEINENLLSTVAEIEINNDNLNKKNQLLESKVIDFENKINEAQKQSILINKQLETHKQKLDTFQNEVKEYVKKQLKYIKLMKEKLDTSKNEADDILEKWKHKSKNDGLQDEESDLNSDTIKKLMDTITSLRSSLIESLNLLESLTSDFDDASTQQILELKNDIVSVQDTIRQLEEMLAELKSENQQLKAEVKELKQIIHLLKENNGAVKTTLQSEKTLSPSQNNELLDDNETSYPSKTRNQSQNRKFFGRKRTDSLRHNEEIHRTKKDNKTMLKVLCGMEVGLLIAYCLPKANYLNLGMHDQQISTLKESTIIVALAMFGIYLIIDKLPVKQYLAKVSKLFGSTKTNENNTSKIITRSQEQESDDDNKNKEITLQTTKLTESFN